MLHDWNDLSTMAGDQELIVNKVTCSRSGISIEGEFELPPLARLSYEDQVFVAMFIKVHGSIKDMELAFGVSYPTVKARLNRVCEKLGFVHAKPVQEREDVLGKLEKGEIDVNEAIERLS